MKVSKKQLEHIVLPKPKLDVNEVMRRVHNIMQDYTSRNQLKQIDQKLVRDYINLKGAVYGWSDE